MFDILFVKRVCIGQNQRVTPIRLLLLVTLRTTLELYMHCCALFALDCS